MLAVGGRLEHDLLAEASGLDARELRESLRAAIAGHLVVVDAEGGHAFRHALLREVVQDDLLPGERVDLHRALAQALERRAAAGDTSAALSAAIASHHLAAGDRRAALAASVHAAAAAEAMRAPGEAAALLERALDLWSRVPDAEAVAGAGHVDLLWRAAEDHNLGGERRRAEPLLRTALEKLDTEAEPRKAAILMARLARFQWHLNRAGQSLDTLRAGLELLPPDENSPERAALLAMRARATMFQGRLHEAVEGARQAQAVAEACDDTGSLGVALNVLGTSLVPLGEVEEGAAALRKAGEIAVERGDPLEVDAAAVNLADALHASGRSHEALEATRRGADQLAATPHAHQWLELMAGEIAFDLGDWDQAARTLPERVRHFDDRTLLAIELRRLHLAMGTGHDAQAAEVLERMRPALEESTEPQFLAPVGVLQAELLRRSGDLDGAREAVVSMLARIGESTEDPSRLGSLASGGVAVEADAAERTRDLGDDTDAGALAGLRGFLERVRAAAAAGGPIERAQLATAEADAARASGTPDPALCAAAAAAWETVERPYPAALARWREAEAHLAKHDRDAATSAATAARETTRRLGAGWLAGEVEALASRGRLRLEPAAAPNAPPARGTGRPFRSHAARAPGAGSDIARRHQPRDRPRALHGREDRERPRLANPDQTRRPLAHRGRGRRAPARADREPRHSVISEGDTSAAREAELVAFRSAAHALVDGVADHLAALPSRPVWQPVPDVLREQLLDLPLPEHPTTLDDLVATALRDVLPHAMGNGHPAFFGWVNPPPSPAGVIASLAAAAMNPSVVSGDHADVHLEHAVVRWLAELVGFPHAPGAGLLTSGGSAATIVCLAGARSRALAAAGHDVRRDGLAGAPQLIAYVPAETHSCVRRALELLGLGSRAMREVPLERGRLDAIALRASIAADRASGALPALLVGSAGTVNAGAIDPLERAGRCRDRGAPLVPRRRRLWRVRRARRSDRDPLPRHGTGRLAGSRPPQVARRSRRRGLRAGAARRRPARRVQPHPAIPTPGRRRAGRYVRRIRPRADETIPRAQDVGDHRRARSRRHRRPGGARERTRPRAGDAGRARTRARAGRRARDLHRRLPRAPGGLSARQAGRAQPRTAGGGSGARPRLRHRHRLRGPRDATRLHPAPRHELGAPRDPRRRGRRDGPHAGRRRVAGRPRSNATRTPPITL